MERGRVREETEQMKERERDGVDRSTGGQAQSSAKMSLKVRGHDPGVIKSVVHTLQLHGQTLQGSLHLKQVRM